MDNIILKHFKSIPKDDPNKYLILYSTVVEETAEMIAQWQSIGFAHGVMNTDNMSIMSVTIDYGPFGFLDAYNPNYIPNSSDDEGMYSYKNQPKIAFGNLKRLGDALIPLLAPDQISQLSFILTGYDTHFKTAYLKLFGKKLGFQSFKFEDENIVSLLLEMMANHKADFTMSFWELGNVSMEALEAKKLPRDFWGLKKIIKNEKFSEFVQLYKTRLQDDGVTEDTRQSTMAASNPRYVLRNWIAQKTIEQVEEGNFHALDETLEILKNPFKIKKNAENKGYSLSPPDWSKSLKVSCSS